MKGKIIAFNKLNISFRLGEKQVFLYKTKNNLSFVFCMYKLGFFTGLKIYKKTIKVSLKNFSSDKLGLAKSYALSCKRKQSYLRTYDFWKNEGVVYDAFVDTSVGLLSKEDALRYKRGGFLRFTLY